MNDETVVPGSLIVGSILNLYDDPALHAAANHKAQIDAFISRMRGLGVSDMQIEHMLDTALAASISGSGALVDNLDSLRRAIADADVNQRESVPFADLNSNTFLPADELKKGHRRAGITKNKGRGESKERRKTASYSRRANRK